MKKIGVIGLALLLWGCSSDVGENAHNETTDDNIIATSRIYQIEGRLTDLSVAEFYPLRLEAVKQGELEKVVLVEPAGDYGAEITVTDKQELDKIAAYFNGIELTKNEASLFPTGEYADFEITLKDREPLYFRIYANFFCSQFSCVEFNSNQSLNEMLSIIKGDYKKVNNIFIYESNTSVETWADRIAVAPIAIDEEAPELIRDIWLNETDPMYNVLRLSYYINEDFDQLEDITDTQLLNAGLIQQTDKYDCFNGTTNVCGDLYSDNLLYFPDGMERIHNYIPDVYQIVPYNNVNQKGTNIFGNSYHLPSFEAGTIANQSYQVYINFPDKAYFTYHTPYEFYRHSEATAYVLDQTSSGDETVFTLAKAKEFYLNQGYCVEGLNGAVYKLNNRTSVFDTIQAHADDFEQWQYVLKQEGDDIRLLSGHRINEKVYQPWQVQPDKETYYVDDTGVLKVNLASADASIFNEWSENQQAFDYQFKANIHEHLLSIWVSSEAIDRKFAVVFDLESGKTLSSVEVLKKLNMNEDKLTKAYQAIPGYGSVPLQIENTETFSFNTTNFFINSKGKPAYNDGNNLILFEWEEVR
ncbi:hypothetical protein [Dielma fastidiosa]|uniref:hypothetical protein n=1 Tax=Dielma fastidiosa TaxID=1034346 RepID=UPI000EDBA69A|nr:hypothetical protein [Dielma fastidiosa]HAH94330.1 hypothetical protein [Dielma fastidiosa]